MTWRERIIIALLYPLYPLIWVASKILKKFAKEGPGWGD